MNVTSILVSICVVLLVHAVYIDFRIWILSQRVARLAMQVVEVLMKREGTS